MKTAVAEKPRKCVTDLAPRCEAVNAMTGKPCGRMLAVKVTRPWTLDCPRCRSRNEKDDA